MSNTDAIKVIFRTFKDPADKKSQMAFFLLCDILELIMIHHVSDETCDTVVDKTKSGVHIEGLERHLFKAHKVQLDKLN